MTTGVQRGRSLEAEGLRTARARWNLTAAALYEEVVRRGEGVIAAHGPLVCRTGPHTGRSPNDKFIARDPAAEKNIAWGIVNRPMSEAQFETLHRDLIGALDGRELLVQDCYAGADPQYRLPIRVITEYAWHSLFARNLFIPAGETSAVHSPEFTIIDAPNFRAEPGRHGTTSEVVIAVSFAERLVLIGGTSYAGEI